VRTEYPRKFQGPPVRVVLRVFSNQSPSIPLIVCVSKQSDRESCMKAFGSHLNCIHSETGKRGRGHVSHPIPFPPVAPRRGLWPYGLGPAVVTPPPVGGRSWTWWRASPSAPSSPRDPARDVLEQHRGTCDPFFNSENSAVQIKSPPIFHLASKWFRNSPRGPRADRHFDPVTEKDLFVFIL